MAVHLAVQLREAQRYFRYGLVELLISRSELLALGRAPIGDDKDGKPREKIAGARARYRNVPDRKMRSFRGIACSGDRKAVLGKEDQHVAHEWQRAPRHSHDAGALDPHCHWPTGNPEEGRDNHTA